MFVMNVRYFLELEYSPNTSDNKECVVDIKEKNRLIRRFLFVTSRTSLWSTWTLNHVLCHPSTDMGKEFKFYHCVKGSESTEKNPKESKKKDQKYKKQ